MQIIQDIRYGIRVLFKHPGFAITALIALALGIGANAAIFSMVNSVLLRPLSFPDSGRLMTIWEDHRALGGPQREWTSPTGFEDWRDQAQSFDKVSAFAGWAPTLADPADPEQLLGAAVSHDMFSLLGVLPVRGREFRPEEDRKGGAAVAVISHELWQRRFSQDPNIIGKNIILSGENFTVVGVMPVGFKFPIISGAEIWRTLSPVLSDGCRRGCYTLRVLARLKPHVTVESARADLRALARRIEHDFPGTNRKVDFAIEPLHHFLVGDVKTPLLVLLGAVCLVLLVACANVANLMLAQSATREREIAIRSALGAGQWRIVRQLLAESLMLALIGGALGLLLAYWMVDLLVTFSPRGTPRIDEIMIDRRVLGFTLAISALTGLLFGLAPARRTSKSDLNQSLKEGSKSSQTGKRGTRTLNMLVIMETALALILLIGAGLLIKSFIHLQRVDLGFNSRKVMTMRVGLARASYPDPQQLAAFETRILDRVRSLPGVLSAGTVSSLPLGQLDTDTSFVIEGRPQPQDNQGPTAWYSSVSKDYFRTMGIQLKAGRMIDDHDNSDSQRVVIINETMARRYFPNENPIGKRIGNGKPDGWREIIGIIADTKHFGLNQDARPSMHYPNQQQPVRGLSLVIRSSGDPLSLVAPVRSEISAIDKNLAAANTRTMEQIVAETIAPQRFILLLLGIFAALAMILAAAGIYGVISYSVAQRTQEIGVRMALGAQKYDVLRLIVGQGMWLVASGMVIGFIGSMALTRLMSTMLFGVSATDLMTFGLVSLLLISVALIACLLPARRAAKVDPMTALRHE